MSRLRLWRRYPWASFWILFSGTGPLGRFFSRMACLFAPPYKGRRYLSKLGVRGFISPTASIWCKNLRLGRNVFIGERVTLYCGDGTGSIHLGDKCAIHQDSILETGQDGSIHIGDNTHIQPRSQISAYRGAVRIGNGVQIAPGCAFYPYNHETIPEMTIMEQPLVTRGGIVIEDDAWLGYGVVVLDGVRIGKGAVIGAGAVVTSDVPEMAIATGVPARVQKKRTG